MHLGSGIRDPGSGKNLFRIPDPGVKKAPDPGSRIRNTGHRNKKLILSCQRTFLQKKIIKYKCNLCTWIPSWIQQLKINADPDPKP
jgi:hypothetical protein